MPPTLAFIDAVASTICVGVAESVAWVDILASANTAIRLSAVVVAEALMDTVPPSTTPDTYPVST